MTYQMMTLDMDGTLLKSDKSIDGSTLQAIQAAISRGKIIAICTGRPMAEMKPYRKEFDEVGIRYYICESGAYIYDAVKEKPLAIHGIDRSCLPVILAAAEKEDIMMQCIINSHSNVTGSEIENMAHWHMEVYIPLYESVADRRDDIHAYARRMYEEKEPFEKINLYHTDPAARERTRQRILDGLADASLLQLVDAETTSLEVSGREADKGRGLVELAEMLGMQRERIIAAGDADNDLTCLSAAGLPIAMANSNAHVLSYVKDHGAVTDDNDHDGVGKAIWKYLIGEE